MYNNVDIISETYEDTASGKLLIRQFQPPPNSNFLIPQKIADRPNYVPDLMPNYMDGWMDGLDGYCWFAQGRVHAIIVP